MWWDEGMDVYGNELISTLFPNAYQLPSLSLSRSPTSVENGSHFFATQPTLPRAWQAGICSMWHLQFTSHRA